MIARRHERTYARQCALQVLYTSEMQGELPTLIATSERYLSSEDEALSDYAYMLIEGVEHHQADIDKRLASTSENWSLARMPSVDRSILRLATYEMVYVNEVPLSVTINEAVELAKGYGGEDESPRFVNGVLGRIAQQIEAEAAAAECDTVCDTEVISASGATESTSSNAVVPEKTCEAVHGE